MIDMSFFGLLFLAYVIQQSHAPAVFATSQTTMDLRLGVINTIVLLTSSWLVALAVDAVRRDDLRAARVALPLAAACGAAFGVVKVVEYSHKITAGYSLETNDFFLFYFVITFIHLLHVLVGTVVLSIMTRKAHVGALGPGRSTGLENAATYWHMVDLLWIMIFALIYLVRWR